MRTDAAVGSETMAVRRHEAELDHGFRRAVVGIGIAMEAEDPNGIASRRRLVREERREQGVRAGIDRQGTDRRPGARRFHHRLAFGRGRCRERTQEKDGQKGEDRGEGLHRGPRRFGDGRIARSKRGQR